ncbi:MAG: dihydrofolate reductase family protein [Parasphingorhabdus sp.]
MRELAILTFVTLDGVMQSVRLPDEDMSGGFAHGGWAAPYWDDVMTQLGRTAMAEPYDMLLGRKTFEMFAANQDDSPNDGHVYTVSSTLSESIWENATILNGNPVEEVARLKEMDGPLLQIHGSWQLIQPLIDAGLIDEFRLFIFPLILGSGKRLFEGVEGADRLKLVRSEPTRNGVVMHIYRKE